MLTLPLYCTGSNRKLGGAWASTVQCLHSTAEGPGSGLSLSLVPDGPFQGVFIAGVLAQLEGDTKLTGSECLEKI